MRAYPRYEKFAVDNTGFVTLEFRDYSPTASAPTIKLILDPVDVEVLYHDLHQYERDLAVLRYGEAADWKNHQPPATKWTAGPRYDKEIL